MRSYILIAFMAVIVFVSAIPITPSAPPLRKRAEQYRLQGLREFEIAQRLSNPDTQSDTSSEPILSLLNNHLRLVFHAPSTDDDASGDIAPGSLDAPQMLPAKAPEADAADFSFLQSLCELFHRGESSFGYEGKELEMRRPTGMRHWKQSFGGFRR
ncbi:hypothetical protein ACN47E_001582 [Coniothyrium glycines]